MRRAFALLALGLAACDGCRSGSEAGSDAAAASSAITAPSALGPRPTSRPVDCTLGPPLHALGAHAVVGDGVASGESAWVGAVARGKDKPTHRVVALADGKATTTELAPAIGDEPPPQPVLARGGTLAVHYASAPGARRLALSTLEATPRALATFDCQADESYAFAAAAREGGALVAWDEDRKPEATGVIKVARVALAGDKDKGDAGAPVRAVSPVASDAESPRVVAGKEGYWLGWLARKPELAADAAVDAPEGPGERRAYSWIEIVLVGDDGAPIGDVRRVTPQAGHVAGFELVADDAGGVIAYVQDEDARADGAGLRIDRVRVTREKVEPAIEVVGAGVGRSSLDVFPTPTTTWVAFADLAEHGQLAVVTTPSAPITAVTPSAFASARPVARLASAWIVLGFSEVDHGDPVLRRATCPGF